MTKGDLIVKPYRKNLRQAAIILNVSQRTIRRMADNHELEWSDGQVTTESIEQYLEKSRGKKKKEILEDGERKQVILRKSNGWIKNW